ncbi:MAG: asparagine synthase (glutamine-hydrolyzing), partial [bacterium]|nr:asparagine synthase (glutamine-hydrolyzing) [bacterium]
MCGIAGIFNFDSKPVAHSQIKAMTDSIAHRGPDGEGYYVDENLALGHRRLAIIDLSPAGHQPMQTEDGRFTITYNGEVYNFKELRIQLESLGHQFHSDTDSEVVLKSYVQWGKDCLPKFNGMFAFSIWDKREKKLFLARDRYGIKPFYYARTSQGFVFASEIKAIVKSGIYQEQLDKEALVEYLTFQNIFTNRTLHKGVKVLMPGHCASVEASGSLKIEKYWDFDFSSSMVISEEEAIEETDRLFQQAVQRQLISDVPVNSYLSGGIDSGAIVMIAKQFISHMKTFTVGFDLSSASGLELSFDERERAEHISYLAQTEHYEMVLKAGDMERCMDHYVHHLEEPRVGQSYPNYYAAKLASRFGKVVLAGTGGDELFGGYPWRYYYTEKEVSFDEFVDNYYLKWQRLFSNTDIRKLLEPIQ